jgi:hypothetical protein
MMTQVAGEAQGWISQWGLWICGAFEGVTKLMPSAKADSVPSIFVFPGTYVPGYRMPSLRDWSMVIPLDWITR